MKEDTEKAILEFCRQYTGETILNQVRNNIAMLSRSIDGATEQAKKNAESSDRIARSLIIVFFLGAGRHPSSTRCSVPSL